MTGELRGIRLDLRRGRWASIGEGDCGGGGEATGERGAISTTEALICCTSWNEDSVGVKIGTGGFGDGESFTGDSGRATTIADGGAFLEPFMVGSLLRLGIAVTLGTFGDFLMVENRLLDELGTLKFGAVVGPGPYVECR